MRRSKLFKIVGMFSLMFVLFGCTKLNDQEDYLNAVYDESVIMLNYLDEIKGTIDNNALAYIILEKETISLKDIIESSEDILLKDQELSQDVLDMVSLINEAKGYVDEIKLGIDNISNNKTSLSDEDFEYLKNKYLIVNETNILVADSKINIDNSFNYLNSLNLSDSSTNILSTYNDILRIMDLINTHLNSLNTSYLELNIMIARYVI